MECTRGNKKTAISGRFIHLEIFFPENSVRTSSVFPLRHRSISMLGCRILPELLLMLFIF
jgi:hypothetical protein